LNVRGATAADAAAIAGMLGELDYPSDPERVRGRLERLGRRADGEALVAEVDGAPLAVIAYQLVDVLERDAPQCRVTTLVTTSTARRRGAARMLVEAVERRARELGCFRLEVTTRPERADASAFYAALGFNERRRRLVKPLD
jgi:GNAT superfamily N-acetyltransferase